MPSPEPDPLRRVLLGGSALHPWLDAAITGVLTRCYFPMSRAWAAALEAGGDTDRFLAALPLRRPPRSLPDALRRLADLRARHEEATARWEATFFGAGDAAAPATAQVAAHAAWLATARGLMGGRGWFAPLLLRNRVPAVRWVIVPPAETAARQGARRADPESAFRLPESLPDPVASRPVARGPRRDYWLRFPAPVLGDTAWASVAEPADRPEAPTVIFMHGLAVDPEYAPDPHDFAGMLVRRGLRVLRPAAPWHGRRRPAGFYGGEATVARGPLSLIESLHAAVVEAGIWAAWARGRASPSGRAPVAMAGFSLGAITAQMAAAAADWPEAARPDALLLIATAGDLVRSLSEGDLGRGVGAPAAFRAAGWTPEGLRDWTPLLVPQRPPALPPQRILAHLGSADRLTFCDDALALLRRWEVPPENVTVRRKGHYTTSLDAALDPRLLHRLAALLDAGPSRGCRQS